MNLAALVESLAGWSGDHDGLLRETRQIASRQPGIAARMRLAGEAAGKYGAFADPLALRQILEHRSDTVRALAAYTIAAHPRLDLPGKLAAIRRAQRNLR